MRRLRVGVNLLWLVPGVVGGSEEYTVGLLLAFADLHADDVEVTLFVNRSFVDRYGSLAERFATVVCPISGGSKPVRVVAESTWLLLEARRRRIDLLHHAGGTIPPLRATPAMVTIHDLQPLVFPEHFSGMKNAYLRWRLAPSARSAKCVVTLTNYTAAMITDRFHVPAEIVPPVYGQVDDERPAGDPAVTYDLSGPFFLYPAITYPHKNHEMLVRAFAGVVAERPDALLVLTHRAAQREEPLRDLITRLRLTNNVRRLGHIPRGDINWLFVHAVALTFPSRFEGFGVPVLEAMGHRCPVIAADAAALPEVVGDAGVLVGPDDESGWTDAMLSMLSDDERREELAEAAFARAMADFQSQDPAQHLRAIYRRVGATTR